MNKFDRRMRLERRRVALIIGNCPAHPVVPNLTNVEVFYPPPNTTSHTQPCDQGIMQAVKVKYRSQLLTKFLDSLDDDVTFRANVLDAIIFLRAAWSNVSATTIANCFRHCGFSRTPEPQVSAEEEEQEEQEEEEEEEEESTIGDSDMLDRLKTITVDLTPEVMVNCDEDLPTSSELTDTEIIQLAQDEARDDNSDEDQDDVSIQKPAAADIREAIQCLRDFSLCTQTDSALLDNTYYCNRKTAQQCYKSPSSTKENN